MALSIGDEGERGARAGVVDEAGVKRRVARDHAGEGVRARGRVVGGGIDLQNKRLGGRAIEGRGEIHCPCAGEKVGCAGRGGWGGVAAGEGGGGEEEWDKGGAAGAGG